jgi:hypothetical protein
MIDNVIDTIVRILLENIKKTAKELDIENNVYNSSFYKNEKLN